MIIRPGVVCVAFTALAILTVNGPSFAATMSYVSQERTISASLTEDFTFDPDNPDPRDGSDTDTAAAPDFGLFDASVEATIGTTFGFSRMSQKSELLAEKMTATGAFSGQTESFEGFYSYRSFVGVTFSINAPSMFLCNADVISSGPFIGVSSYSVSLARLDVPGDIFNEELDLIFDEHVFFSQAGIIPAGTYRVEFLRNDSSDSGMNGDYDFTFEVNDAAIIPLPPPVWSAMGTFAGMATLNARRRHLA